MSNTTKITDLERENGVLAVAIAGTVGAHVWRKN
jgi:hypothetical protein